MRRLEGDTFARAQTHRSRPLHSQCIWPCWQLLRVSLHITPFEPPCCHYETVQRSISRILDPHIKSGRFPKRILATKSCIALSPGRNRPWSESGGKSVIDRTRTTSSAVRTISPTGRWRAIVKLDLRFATPDGMARLQEEALQMARSHIRSAVHLLLALDDSALERRPCLTLV